jgi:two-component system NtrC family sensor kinase
MNNNLTFNKRFSKQKNNKNTLAEIYKNLSLRGKIILPFVSIFIAVWTGATLSMGYYVNRTLEQRAYRDARSFAASVLQEFEHTREQLRLNARLLADRERLARAIKEDDRVTLQRILLPLRISFSFDRITVVDRQGQVVADLRQSNLSGAKIVDDIAIAQILNAVESSTLAIAELNDRTENRPNPALLLGTARIKSSLGIEGGLLVGRIIDDLLLSEIARGIEGANIAAFHGDRLIASNLAEVHHHTWQPPPIGQIVRIAIGSQSYIAKTVILPNLAETQLSLVLFQPLAPLQQAQQQVWSILGIFCGIGTIVSMIVGHWIARLITHRINGLISATEQVGSGKLATRLRINSDDEIGQLSGRFNLMAAQLEERETQIQDHVQKLEKALQDLSAAQSHLVAEKMSSLGKMIAGIAHEINNPVSFIYGNIPHADAYLQELQTLLTLYQKHYPQPVAEIADRHQDLDLEFLFQDFYKIIGSMRQGADRIRTIVLDLRNFSRLDESEYKAVNIHQGLDGAIGILRHRLHAKLGKQEIAIVKDYGEIPNIHCYAGQLNQVFLNLLSNAIDALELPRQRPREDQWTPAIHLKTSFDPGQKTVKIQIIDNGEGIEEAIADKIFDPFFTTKAIGQGTGLGLTVSYQIVTQKHKGHLSCHSQLGKGTEFAIELPLKVDS